MNDHFKSEADRQLGSLMWRESDCEQVFSALRGEQPKMKKKLSTGLVLALVLALAAAVALAAVTVSRSAQATVMTTARQALMEKYGLTTETLGCFVSSAVQQEGGGWTVTLIGDGFYPGLLGAYTVEVNGDNAAASWSHDDVDKALVDSGDLSAPAWGQRQIEQALRDPDAAYEVQQPLYATDVAVPATTPSVDPNTLNEGERLWQGEIICEGTPGTGDLTKEQALEIAYQALAEDFDLTDEELTRMELVDVSFSVRQNGGTLWGVSTYLVRDGVEWGCGVTLDGKTGEVQLTNVVTGGNG